MPPRKRVQSRETEQKEQPPDTREVGVPFGDNPQETAILLLAAAEETGRDQSVVRSSSGVFYVPADLAKQAGVEVMKDE